MNDLRELYQQLILDHNQNPRNFRTVEDANHQAYGHNPLCGDELVLTLKLEDDVVRDIGFQGSGCAISKASASIMTTVLKGKTRAEALDLLEHFHRMATTGEVDADKLGKDGQLDPERLETFAFALWSYYAVGPRIGRFGFSRG